MKNNTLLLLALISFVHTGTAQESDLSRGFADPGNRARPKAYWNWLNGDVRPESLTRDLEEAKAKGLGGLQIWDTEAMRNPDGFVPAGPPFMGKASVAAILHALKEAKRLALDLGDVRELAEVFVNGKSAGILWKPPFRADITELVKAGANDLKIEVMNLWCNRLAGDNELPVNERFTKTNIKTHGYRTEPNYWVVQPAGLLGPVRLVQSFRVTG